MKQVLLFVGQYLLVGAYLAFVAAAVLATMVGLAISVWACGDGTCWPLRTILGVIFLVSTLIATLAWRKQRPKR